MNGEWLIKGAAVAGGAAADIHVRDGVIAEVGPRLYQDFLSRNLLVRPLGNTIYVMPPYCVTQADLDEIYAAIMEAASL